MSARRFFGALALALAAGAVSARPARAADSIVVQVAGQLAARAGHTITVPVTVDMRGAPGRTLGGYTLTFSFDTAAFYYYGDSAGNFAAPLANTDSSGKGQVRFTAILPAGATGLITLFAVQLYVKVDTLVSAITITPTQLTAASGSTVPFEDLLPITRVVNGSFCRSLGTWGDVDGDGQANSRDALAALSEVVGLPLDTTLMTPVLADVDGDGKVTSRDALIILSYAVGLPVSGYRLGQVAAGACGTGNATALAILPDSLELSAGQTVPVLVRATDATGRTVSIPSLTWTSSDANVAMFSQSGIVGAPPAGRIGGMQLFYSGAGVQARAAGTATITATLAPGVTAQLKVVVLPHRRTWYVDIRRARNAPTQTGSQLYPFEFIGDAVDPAVARDGDSVLVAGGEYDEQVSSQLSVVLLGDSADQPVIDMRGAPYYTPYSFAVSLGSAAAAAEMAHFVVRGNGVYLEAHDMFVHDVAVQLLGGQYPGLEISSMPNASLGTVPGNVRVDRVTTDGAVSEGIRVDQADSVTITSSTVARDSAYTGTCSLYSGALAGIGVPSANATLIQGNTVTDAACAGILAYQTTGRARITGNRILRPSGVGILVNAPIAVTDHNVIRTIAANPGNSYQNAYGIYVDVATPVDSAVSLADSVVGAHGYYSHAAVYVAGATNTTVDSLVADSIGDAGTSYYGNGVTAFGTRIGVSHSRLTNLVGSGMQAGTSGFEFASQHNVVANAAGGGISFTANCDCSAYPDSASSDGDSIIVVGGHSIDFAYAKVARVQNAVLDSAASFGVYLYGYTGAPVASVVNSKISRTNTGISSAGMATLQISGDSLLNNGTGAYIQQTADTVRVGGTIVSGGSSGLVFWYNPVVVDSSAMINTLEGFYLDGGYGGFISRSRFQADSVGLVMGNSPHSLTVSGSNFQGNQVAVDNQEAASGADTIWVYAAGNYWGTSAGPTCDSIYACPGNGIVTGDSLKTTYNGLRVDYTGFLTSPAAPTAAPRAFASSAFTTGAVRRAGQNPTVAPSRTLQPLQRRALFAAPLRQATTVPAAPRARYVFPPAWQKGRPPRAASAR